MTAVPARETGRSQVSEDFAPYTKEFGQNSVHEEKFVANF